MKNIKKIFGIIVLIFVALFILNGCNEDEPTPGGDDPIVEHTCKHVCPICGKCTDATCTDPKCADKCLGHETEVDYAGELKLDMSSESLKVEATVKNYVDGDTTHFYVEGVNEYGVLKARYLAVNTPESTGKIEQYGKTASNFTKEKLKNASSIIIESDDNHWNVDSTGGRYLVWIWYKPAGSNSYRNLNVELLQNGLAIASNSTQNRYGEICGKAIDQAKAFKLNIYSGKNEPGFYVGGPIALTLKELRTNIEEYNGKKVAFEGNVFMDNSQTVYIEDYDDETGIYYGIQVYYGFGADADVLQMLRIGNRVRIVGVVSYYETGGTYQVSGLTYRAARPDDPNNTMLVKEGVEAGYKLTEADTFVNGKISIEKEVVDDDGNEKIVKEEFDYGNLVMNTSIEMHDLEVVRVYTTVAEDSSSKGAMTITCKCGDITVTVRTIVLYDSERNLITEDVFKGKTIDVKGMVDYYNGSYQIKLFSIDDVVFK